MQGHVTCRDAGSRRSGCLTSHKDRLGRSTAAWEAFCGEKPGPDVTMLGSNNRLDIVVRKDGVGSIGVEVKCLGRGKKHSGKFTQGLGQAVLGLANRDRTVLAIHCGTVSARQRAVLREIARKLSRGSRTAIVVVPGSTLA